MKKRKIVLNILNLSALLFICLYTPIVAFKNAREYEIYSKPTIDTKIYTIWHIETFEGGSLPRVNYLKSIARKIESENDGILFYIKSINPNHLREELLSSTPDIISFGYGVGKIVLPKLKNLDNTYSVRDELLNSGMFNNKLFALPYIVSGYAIITHGVLTQNVHAGSLYNNVQPILDLNNLSLSETESGYEAYKDFVYNKDVTLIGSGRDVFRVDNLNAVGRTNASITPVDYYTDLIQYISLCNVDEFTKKFVSLTLDNNNQFNLNNYHLYSAKYSKIYSSGIYSDMEDALMKCRVPNVFL